MAVSDIGARLSPETRGILGIVLAMLLFTCMDGCAKYLLARNDTVMVVWARFASQMGLVLAISAPMLRTYLRTARPGLQLGRSTLHALATGMFFYALNFMPLAENVAVFEVAPLLITLLAALVLGEQVGPRRWAGVGDRPLRRVDHHSARPRRLPACGPAAVRRGLLHGRLPDRHPDDRHGGPACARR